MDKDNLLHQYTYDKYLALEADPEAQYEYHYGKVYAMAGASKTHNRIVRNVTNRLDAFLDLGCMAFSENVKLEVISQGIYRYPDVVFTCDERDHQDPYMVRYPSLLVEVLSEGTKSVDLDEKTEEYLTLPSLQAYLILYQDRIAARLYLRSGNEWVLHFFLGKEANLTIESLGIHWNLGDLYKYVVLDNVGSL